MCVFYMFYIFKMRFTFVQYLGWLAKLGCRGGSNIGTPSEDWRFAVFPFAILQILVNPGNYENFKRAYIIDQQYTVNMALEGLPAVAWLPFVNSTNKTTSWSSDGQVIVFFFRIDLSKSLIILANKARSQNYLSWCFCCQKLKPKKKIFILSHCFPALPGVYVMFSSGGEMFLRQNFAFIFYSLFL